MTENQSSRRAMLRTIVHLAWPAMLEQALQTLVQYADSAMVGRVGVQATAAVGLTTTVIWMTHSPIWAMGAGFLATIARATGARDAQKVRTLTIQAILMALGLGAVLTLVTQAIAPQLPVWLGADPEIRRDGTLYFAILCAPMLFRALSTMMSSCLRAIGDTRTPMVVNLGMNLINVVLNFFLIFPTRSAMIFGTRVWMPGAGWGVVGAAVASAISIVFSGTMMLVKVLRNEALSPKGLPFKPDGEALRECVRIGLPVALQDFGVFGGHVVFSAQVTSLGKTALAAHTIALTAEQAFYIPGYGMKASVTTLVGQSLGEKDEAKLRRASLMGLCMSMGLMTVGAVILFAFAPFMMGIFTADAAVIEQGARVLRIVACSEPIYAAMIILDGIFQGIGQTRYPFFVALTTMWGARVLGTIILVRAFGCGLSAVWLCMIADNIARALLLALRYFSGKWKKQLNLG